MSNVRSSTSRNLAGIFLAAFALAGVSGCEKKTAPTPPPPIVEVLPAAKMDVPVFQEWVGTLDGYQNAQIQAKVVGYLLTQDYQEGAFVESGTKLFTIDPRPFQAALAQTQAELGRAQASELRTRLDAERATELYGKAVISKQEFDNKTQLNKADEAAVSAAEAAVQAAQINLDYTTITAPFPGIVGKAQAQIGDLVGSSGSPALTAMSILDPIKVYFPISEQEYMRAAEPLKRLEEMPEKDRPARLELTLASGQIYPKRGSFYFADRQVDSRTGTIQLAATFPNPNGLLRPGQFGRVSAEIDLIKDAIVVPQKSVAELQGKYSVRVIGADNKAEMRPVKVGPRYDQIWVIESGLKEGEVIVVEGLMKAKPGTVVNPKPAPSMVPPKTQPDGMGDGPLVNEGGPSAPAPTAVPTPSSTPAAAPAPTAVPVPTVAPTLSPAPEPSATPVPL